MSLQSSKKHNVNGMTTTAVCSPHPNPLPGGARGLFTARFNLWGTLSPRGEGEHRFRNSCAFASRFLILTLITIILTACDERFPMSEEELFCRRPMGMRMAMIVRQCRAVIDDAILDTG